MTSQTDHTSADPNVSSIWMLKRLEPALITLWIWQSTQEIADAVGHSASTFWIACKSVECICMAGGLWLIWRRWKKDQQILSTLFLVLPVAVIAEHWMRWQAAKDDMFWHVALLARAALFLAAFAAHWHWHIKQSRKEEAPNP